MWLHFQPLRRQVMLRRGLAFLLLLDQASRGACVLRIVIAGECAGWLAARPSGTENIYKIYAESFKNQSHLNAIVSEAEEIVNKALISSNPGRGHAEGR
jgi:hypothetical protein